MKNRKENWRKSWCINTPWIDLITNHPDNKISDCAYTKFALAVNGKLYAIGDEDTRNGGITDNITWMYPQEFREKINRLKDGDGWEDKEITFHKAAIALYEKIKDMPIAELEDLPTTQRVCYQFVNTETNEYYRIVQNVFNPLAENEFELYRKGTKSEFGKLTNSSDRIADLTEILGKIIGRRIFLA